MHKILFDIFLLTDRHIHVVIELQFGKLDLNIQMLYEKVLRLYWVLDN